MSENPDASIPSISVIESPTPCSFSSVQPNNNNRTSRKRTAAQIEDASDEEETQSKEPKASSKTTLHVHFYGLSSSEPNTPNRNDSSDAATSTNNNYDSEVKRYLTVPSRRLSTPNFRRNSITPVALAQSRRLSQPTYNKHGLFENTRNERTAGQTRRTFSSTIASSSSSSSNNRQNEHPNNIASPKFTIDEWKLLELYYIKADRDVITASESFYREVSLQTIATATATETTAPCSSSSSTSRATNILTRLEVFNNSPEKSTLDRLVEFNSSSPRPSAVIRPQPSSSSSKNVAVNDDGLLRETWPYDTVKWRCQCLDTYSRSKDGYLPTISHLIKKRRLQK